MTYDHLVGWFVSGVTRRKGLPLLVLADHSNSVSRGLRLYVRAPFEIEPQPPDRGYEDPELIAINRLESLIGLTISNVSVGDAGDLDLEFGAGDCTLSISGLSATENAGSSWQVVEA